ncbi:hypothetical protein LEA50_19100 [Salmonella enterica]|uniref:hypothetical protein n=1 Tax=Citrobacter portucalensis TaxID=1639133 RepID=UPI002AD0CDBE|nr:hypothetical protein [Salmonella enterica]MDJ7584467.1 hypothetical protein [Salmonella enterica]
MARKTPPHLERALSRVKAYVLRYPNGVEESDLYKVDSFSVLSKKERQQLVGIIESTSALHVTRSGKPGKEKLWFQHMRFTGIPEDKVSLLPAVSVVPAQPTVTEVVNSWREEAPPKHQCMSCGTSKPLSEFPDNNGKPLETCSHCLKRLREETMLAKHPTHQQSSDPLAGFTPEQLIKISEMALSRAKEAKEAQTARDAITKQLEPIRREVLQAHQKVTKAFDTMVDGMAELDKAMAKLRGFKVEI